MKTLCIDFGHGGKDWGATNRRTGLKEKNVVLSLKDTLDELFEGSGVLLIYTRKHDSFRSLRERSRLANYQKADLFYSIHCNAANRSATGIECFYYKYSKRSKRAAEACQKNLMSFFPTHKNRGVKGANYSVLRRTNMMAVLWELEFIDTQIGHDTLTDPEKMRRYAYAIYQSAMHNLQLEPKTKRTNRIKQWIGCMKSKKTFETH